MRVRYEDLRLGPNVCAGMNFLTVACMVRELKTSVGDLVPIEVRREGDCWQVVDGRHRVVAGMIAGRADILASEVSAADTLQT
jgi:hypothetical protein